MYFRRIIAADGRRDAPLGILGVALIDAALGENEDIPHLASQQSGVEAGDSTPDDDEVETFIYHCHPIPNPDKPEPKKFSILRKTSLLRD
ncbi:MAG: hypothetical protein DDT28_00324 [Dehalococcoidia bacterium]|nr:hypothetical protein [Chloroflexota bacterium]